MMTSNHEPGPQLDALVASALGLDVLGMAAATRPVYLTECVCDDMRDYDAEILGHIAGCLEVVPCYSTDDREALAAVDKVLASGKWPAFKVEWRQELRGYWAAWFTHVDIVLSVVCNAPTRALAICRAIVTLGEGAGNDEPYQG